MKVVVVESPAKAKTINKYLGSDYKVLASFGHVRDLPPKDGSVRPDADFEMDWEVDGKSAKRTIEIGMGDNMRFTPERIEVRQGETVKFVVRNAGKTMHEFVIGTRRSNEAHAAMMLKAPGMEHDEPYMAHVPPGRRGEIVWRFNRAGQFEFACLIAGHYQAGMVGAIHVRA